LLDRIFEKLSFDTVWRIVMRSYSNKICPGGHELAKPLLQ